MRLSLHRVLCHQIHCYFGIIHSNILLNRQCSKGLYMTLMFIPFERLILTSVWESLSQSCAVFSVSSVCLLKGTITTAVIVTTSNSHLMSVYSWKKPSLQSSAVYILSFCVYLTYVRTCIPSGPHSKHFLILRKCTTATYVYTYVRIIIKIS